VAGELVGRKATRNYTAAKADLHEADRPYLERVAELYAELAREQRRSRWLVIDSTEAGVLRPPAAIADELWNRLQLFA
jgi:thymidylate kinase